MPVRRPSSPRARRVRAPLAVGLSVALVLLGVAEVHGMWQPFDAGLLDAGDAGGHLVVSEISTGGSSASDELIELFNPGQDSLPLEGLELVYVTASGTTVTRKASWPSGAPEINPGGHLLVANEAGIYAALADATYSGGLAATGGSVALRILGATTAIDAIGWGNAANGWLEGETAPAPPAGSSLERLPGGTQGSFQDTDSNLLDFAIRETPDPQNSTSPPIVAPAPTPTSPSEGSPTPGPTLPETSSPTPSPASTPSPTQGPTATPAPPSVTPSATPSPTAAPPAPQMVSIADARQLADGTRVVLAGVTLSDSAFSEGGGYLADDTGGIAVLLSDGSFERGRQLQVAGLLDTRYEQRTLRATGADLVDLGAASEREALPIATGSVGEPVEAILVAIEGEVASSATVLSGGLAFDVDDGSGPVRVLVGSSTGIDTAGWQRGALVAVSGVVGQRDATGTGIEGYRVQPRTPADVRLTPAPLPTPSPTPTPPGGSPAPSATPSPSDAGLISIVEARTRPTGAEVRIRGVVTVGAGLIDPTSLVVQDASAAIVIRLSGDATQVRRGELVEVQGTRSTKSGMLTVRADGDPIVIGSQAEPSAERRATGTFGEELEARLVVARGALTAAPRRSSTGTVSLAIDDGSGEIRVSISRAAAIDLGTVPAGAWIEVRGVLGQETTGSQPLRGYRIWPRDEADFDRLADSPAVGAGAAYVAATAGSPRPAHAAADGQQAGVPRAAGSGGARGGSEPALAAVRPAGDAASATPGLQPGRTDPSRPLAVLALALTAGVALGCVAWRSHAAADLLARLWPGLSAGEAVEGGTPATGDSDLAEAAAARLPRLSVIRIPHEPGSS